jgi:hypothetical protein
MTATDEYTAIVVNMVSAQAHEAPLLDSMLKATQRSLTMFDELVGDKSSTATRRVRCVSAAITSERAEQEIRIKPWPQLTEGELVCNQSTDCLPNPSDTAASQRAV